MLNSKPFAYNLAYFQWSRPTSSFRSQGTKNGDDHHDIHDSWMSWDVRGEHTHATHARPSSAVCWGAPPISSCSSLGYNHFYEYHLCTLSSYVIKGSWMWHSVSAGGLLIKAYVQIANSRGGRCLVLDDYDYRYVRNKVRNNQMYWRCARAGCGVYMTTVSQPVSQSTSQSVSQSVN